jgi:hypothetical protein
VSLVAVLCFLATAGYVLLSVPSIRSQWTWAQTSEDRAAALELKLGSFLDDGNAIAQRLTKHPGPPDAELFEIRKDGIEWATALRDLLRKERPSLVPVFLDDTSDIEYVSQYAQRDEVANWMKRRLERLGDVLERVQTR